MSPTWNVVSWFNKDLQGFYRSRTQTLKTCNTCSDKQESYERNSSANTRYYKADTQLTWQQLTCPHLLTTTSLFSTYFLQIWPPPTFIKTNYRFCFSSKRVIDAYFLVQMSQWGLLVTLVQVIWPCSGLWRELVPNTVKNPAFLVSHSR